MTENEEEYPVNQEEYPVNPPPKWLYGIIIAMGIGIVGMVIAIGYGLIVGFDKKVDENGEVLVKMEADKKYPDFNIKLKQGQSIEQVKYRDFKIIVYVKDASNKENLILILSATNGNEVGRFVIGE